MSRTTRDGPVLPFKSSFARPDRPALTSDIMNTIRIHPTEFGKP